MALRTKMRAQFMRCVRLGKDPKTKCKLTRDIGAHRDKHNPSWIYNLIIDFQGTQEKGYTLWTVYI